MWQPKSYNIYPSLLDAYTWYLGADENYERTSMKVDIDTYKEQQLQSLIDKINRVPFESEAADRGTCFNEVVDCIIHDINSDKMLITKHPEIGMIRVKYNNRTFNYPIELCRQFAAMYPEAISQEYIEAILPTSMGNVKLYGYIDELLPLSVHDIKTTSKYVDRKFFNHAQHLVYPYCLIKSGDNIHTFEYNITDFHDVYKEVYVFDEERDTKKLTEMVEDFISFLEKYRDKITDKKIFNYDTNR